MEKIPVLLDTDIGSDIDDAVALAYLLCHPQCELLGVTTVTGDVQKRAALVEIVCRAAGRDEVPIHCGQRDVLGTGPGQPNVPQYDAVAERRHTIQRKEDTAVAFLRDTIRSRPGEIVLLTIGPFSNVALLFEDDPEIPSLVKSVVSMGGQFCSEPHHEWNAICDPLATTRAYEARHIDHLSVGLDVTQKCTMSAHEVRSRFVGEPLQTVGVLAEKWFDHSHLLTFHDPLAAAIIFRPDLCTWSSGKVHVDPEGRTTFTQGEGTDRVAIDVNVEAFFEDFFSVTSSH